MKKKKKRNKSKLKIQGKLPTSVMNEFQLLHKSKVDITYPLSIVTYKPVSSLIKDSNSASKFSTT